MGGDERGEESAQQVAVGPDRALLRQLVVLAHAVPGAELRLTALGGEVLKVGRHPSNDLTPCQVRAALLASATPEGPDCFAVLADVELGGSLRDVGGGFCHVGEGDEAERWFATCLHPRDVARLAGSVESPLPKDAIEAGVIADVELGAAAVRVRPANWRYADELDAVARSLWSACLVEELYRQALGAPSPAPAPEPRRRSR